MFFVWVLILDLISFDFIIGFLLKSSKSYKKLIFTESCKTEYQSEDKLWFIVQYMTLNGIPLDQGFSTFWYSRTPKSKLYPSAYPHPLRVPPNKNSTQISFIWVRFFDFCVLLWALRVPPVASSRTPRGTRTPGWEPLL